jgi:chromosome partitioning protein
MDRPDTDALVIAVQNPKGGCGKTTIAVHLARAVQMGGFDVVILDSDTQGTARDWRARSPADYDGPRVQAATNPRQLVRSAEEHGAGADVVVIDGSARLGKHTGAVVAAADVVLIPVQPTAFDLWGTVEFMDTVEGAAASGDVRPAFVASRRDPRTRLSKQLSGALEPYGFPVLEGTAQRVAYAYAVQDGRTVLDGYDDKAAGEIRQLLADVAEIAA